MQRGNTGSVLASQEASQASTQTRAFAALFIANISIAFGPLLVRLADTGPVASGFWRLALAVPLLGIFAYRSGFRFGASNKGLMLLALLCGVFFAADIVTWHLGIFRTKLGNATLFANCASLLLVIYAVVLTRKWPGRIQGSAIFLAFAGGALLMGQSFELSAKNLTGDLLCLAAGVFYTVYLVWMIRVRGGIGSWAALFLPSVSCAVLLLPVALMLGEQIWPGNWWPLLLLALGSQVIGQGLLTYALPHLSPTIIGLALLLQPALSAGAGWFAFGEALSMLDVIGGSMVMAALVLVRVAEPAQPR